MDSNATCPVPVFPDMSPTLGALEIANVVAMFMLGIFVVQVYIYHRYFPNDSWLIKSLVIIMLLFEIGHAITSIHALYVTTIIQYGHPEMLAHIPNSLNITVLFEGLITIIVQGFFSLRLYRLLPTPWIAYGCWALAVIRFGFSFALCVLGFNVPSLQYYEEKYHWMLTALLVIGAFVDVVIAAALCLFLYWQRSSIRQTARMLDRLIAWTISNGLLTSIVSIVTVICFSVMSDNFWWITAYTWLAKSYSNSMLASLNARADIKDSSQGDVYAISTIKVTQRSTATNPELSVDVHRSVEMHDDSTKPYPLKGGLAD